MTGFKQGVIAILLAASLALAASEAYAKVPRLCASSGCYGGPDICVSASVTMGSVTATLNCYTKIGN
jgi:hypothetical protein